MTVLLFLFLVVGFLALLTGDHLAGLLVLLTFGFGAVVFLKTVLSAKVALRVDSDWRLPRRPPVWR